MVLVLVPEVARIVAVLRVDGSHKRRPVATVSPDIRTPLFSTRFYVLIFEAWGRVRDLLPVVSD